MALFALAACSTLPEAHYPPFADHAVVADYVVAQGGLLPVPSSQPRLVVRELRGVPEPTAERFGPHGERFWVYPPGTEVQLRCRFRAYADARGAVPAPADVLPGARSVRPADAP